MSQAIFKRDNGVCQLCGQPVDGDNYCIDHVIPRSKGGSMELANLQLAHPKCNVLKDEAIVPRFFFKAFAEEIHRDGSGK